MRLAAAQRLATGTWQLPTAVGLLFFALYAATATTTVQGGDAGELVTVACQGGVAHPPGYPLFVLLGRAACALLPFGTPAWRLALVSALQASLALALLVAAIRRATGSSLAALSSALLLGLSPLFWRYATVGEVFAGGVLTAALLVLIGLRIHSGWRGWPAALALGLACATGVAHHHSSVLLFPLVLVALWQSVARPRRPGALLVAGGAWLLGAGTGLLPYLSLLEPGGAWRWGALESLAQLPEHLLRVDYGTLQLAANQGVPAGPAHLLNYLWHLVRELPLLLLLLGLGVWKARLVQPRIWAAALTAAALLAGPGLLLLFNVPASGLGAVVAQRFFLLPDTLLTVLGGLGLAALLHQLKIERSWLKIALIALPLASALLLGGPRLGHRGWSVAEDYVLNALRTSAEGALVVGSSDSELGGYLYVQEVLERRPDLLYVAPPLLARAWYRDRLARQRPALAPALTGATGSSQQQLLTLIELQLQRGPVYLALDLWRDRSLRAQLPPLIPDGGTLLQVLPRGQPAPPLDKVERDLQQAIENLQLNSWPRSQAELEHSWEGDLYLNYARSYQVLAELYRDAGDGASAQRCLRLAQRLARPWEQ